MIEELRRLLSRLSGSHAISLPFQKAGLQQRPGLTMTYGGATQVLTNRMQMPWLTLLFEGFAKVRAKRILKY